MSNPGMLKVAAAQIGTDSDVVSNADKIRFMIEKAYEKKCGIVLFHEGCLTGYPNEEQVNNLDFNIVGAYEKEMTAMAGKLNIALLIGSTRKVENEIYNDVMIVREDGHLLGRYAKTWRAGEPWYSAGTGPVIFTVGGVESTVMICHDLRYPELVRLPVAAGAQIIFIANNEGGLHAENKLLGYRSMQISRATESHVFGVMANAPADVENMNSSNSSHGNSKIVDPLGNVLDEAGSFEERLVTADLDISQAIRQPALRTIGRDSSAAELYGTEIEYPEYAAWLKQGLKLVTRLDGDGS
ncbi:MAG: carbon-nitrogen hydrolase family protein [Gemmatimonadota bacterium]|nr:carbon-nitrogen hydrolase family protein [Gemmatimonadota bacterium]